MTTNLSPAAQLRIKIALADADELRLLKQAEAALRRGVQRETVEALYAEPARTCRKVAAQLRQIEVK